MSTFNICKFYATFQIGSFNGSRRITSGINVNGEIFVVTSDGNFGKININECAKYSFVSLAKLDIVSTEIESSNGISKNSET